MADRLRNWAGGKLPPAVEAAMRAVAREAFLPGTPLDSAYGSSPVVTHRDPHGVATSSASAPGLVAAMLAQLDVRPGHRILEIGAGTGYNAALLACLTGPAGQVTTVELDPASPPRPPVRSRRPGTRGWPPSPATASTATPPMRPTTGSS
jgi:protein-L-isoaspartate(D-aspartate) O-methyltransferase